MDLESTLAKAGVPLISLVTPEMYTVRHLLATSACSGGLRQPDPYTAVGNLTYIALNGSSFVAEISNVAGTLESFLGTGYNSALFDPAYIGSESWAGVEWRLPKRAFLEPTLKFTAGGNPGVPLNAAMDLSQPDSKILEFDLGAQAANLKYSVLVSSTFQSDGALAAMDGVTLPLVFDTTTQHFLENFPELVGTTDSQGKATFSFPALYPDPAIDYNFMNLSIAVVVHDSDTGKVSKASTYVGLQLEDQSCPQ